MKTVLNMLMVLTSIGLIAGGLLSQIAIWADPLILENKLKATEEAIYLVQPDGKDYEKIESKDLEVYKVFDSEKNHIGYSLACEGNGFAGKIRMMVGLNTDLDKVVAIEVLEQVETPGLGTKVVEEPFTKMFRGLSTLPKIGWVKEGTEKKENEIVAITGATISCKAVVEIANNGINKLKSYLQGAK